MADTFRVGVTGSRAYASPDIIESALITAQDDRPAAQMVLVHGRCDPRSPRGYRIGWDAALLMSEDAQMALHGADWLADRIATKLGWQIEPHPADWRSHPRAGGFIRNAQMVSAGAGAWLAFIDECRDPKCRRRPLERHGSHGASNCAGLAEEAGIPTRRYEA